MMQVKWTSGYHLCSWRQCNGFAQETSAIKNEAKKCITQWISICGEHLRHWFITLHVDVFNFKQINK